MQQLASILRRGLDAASDGVAGAYARRLREIPGYSGLPHQVRLDVARRDIDIIATCLEAEDDEPFVAFTRERAVERFEQGFAGEDVNATLGALEETLLPLVSEAETAKFLWRALSRSRDVVSRQAGRMLRRSEEALRESEALFRSVVENSPTGIFIVGEAYQFVYANEGLSRIVGYSPEEIIGLDFRQFLDEESKQVVADRYVRRQRGEDVPSRYELGIIRKDGEKRLLEMSAVVIQDPMGNPQTVAQVLDVTERERARRRLLDLLERRGEQVELTTEIAQEIATAPVLEEIYERVVTLVKERFGYYHVQIFRYEPRVDAMRVVEGYGHVGDRMKAAGHSLPYGEGVVGTAAASGEPILASDVTTDPHWRPHPDLPATEGELAVPIKLRDEVLGVLDVQSDEVGALTEEDQLVLLGLAGQIASVIQSNRLRAEMKENLSELERLTRTMSREGWEAFRDEAKSVGYLFDRVDVAPKEDIWMPEIELAAKRQALVSPTSDDGAVAVAPLSVRGEVIGALGVQDDPRQPLSQEDLDLVTSVSEQVALALESARLFQRTQSALSEQQRLVAILEAVPDLVGVLDGEGRITYLNPGGREMAGMEEGDELTGVSLREFLPDRLQPLLVEEAIPTAREEGVWRGEMAVLTRDGREIPVLQVIVSHGKGVESDGSGKRSGEQEYFTIARDITERKLAEAEMEETLHELERLTRTMSREGWEAFRREAGTGGYLFDHGNVVQAEDVWTPELRLAAEVGSLVTPKRMGKAGGEESATVAPLSVRGEIIGALGIQDDPENPLSAEEIALVEAVSEEMAQALESGRLFEQTQTARAEAETLYDVTRSLMEASEPEEMLDAVAAPAFQAGATTATLAYVDPDDEGRPEWGVGVARKGDIPEVAPALGERYRLSKLPMGQLLISEPDHPHIIADVGTHMAAEQQGQGTSGALVLMPLRVGGRWVGLVTLGWPEPRSFNERERRLYEVIAPQLATAVENIRLFEQTQKALEDVEAIHRLYLREQWERFVPTRVSPFYERARPSLSDQYRHDSDDGPISPQVERAIAERKLVRSDGADGESALVAPLTLRGEVIGALGFHEPEGDRQWTKEEIALIESVADELALAVESARLLEETQRRAQRERLVADITSKVRASSDVETIMRTAVRELGKAMNTDRTRVQLAGQRSVQGEGQSQEE